MIKGKYYEDINIGDYYVTPGRTVNESAITSMLTLGGMRNPIFLDEGYASKSVFKSCIAPGELTIVFMGGLNEQLDMWWDTVLVGIDKVKFRNPLKSGDTIHNEIEIISKRETSKHGWGLIIDRSTCKNQKDKVVAELEFIHLIPRRA